MIIVKVFNNNIVLVKNKKTAKESILWGKGVGFQKKAGQKIVMNKNDAIFVKEAESDWSRSFLSLSEEIPLKYFEVAKKIVQDASANMQATFNPFLLISLADHIFFTIKRAKEKSGETELPISEIKEDYYKEFKQAQLAKNYIEQEFDVALPESEAGFLAIHFVENEKESVKNYDDSKQIKNRATNDILEIIAENLHLDMTDEKVNFRRLKTHLKFLLTRIQNKEFFRDSKEDKKLYRQIIKNYPELLDCEQAISDYLAETFNYHLSKSEQIYLIMHLRQIVKQKDTQKEAENED